MTSTYQTLTTRSGKTIKVFRSTKTECGFEYQGVGLIVQCPACNEGAHSHFASGSCDFEPCVRHGGPQ